VRRPDQREGGPRAVGRGPGPFGPPGRVRGAGFERDRGPAPSREVRGPAPREGQEVARQLETMNRNLERLIQQLERIAASRR
jgi:hypothetical protein